MMPEDDLRTSDTASTSGATTLGRLPDLPPDASASVEFVARARNGSGDRALFHRRAHVKRIGTGAHVIIGAVQDVFSSTDAALAALGVTIAVNANGALVVNCTGAVSVQWWWGRGVLVPP